MTNSLKDNDNKIRKTFTVKYGFFQHFLLGAFFVEKNEFILKQLQ
jgi:hypothetical protein